MAGRGEDGFSPAQDPADSADVTVLLGEQGRDGQVTVSRADLAGLSPVFHSMLTHHMAEKIQGRVKLEPVTWETWTVISGFYFSGEKLVTEDNVQEVVSVADMYELVKLKNHCDDF